MKEIGLRLTLLGIVWEFFFVHAIELMHHGGRYSLGGVMEVWALMSALHLRGFAATLKKQIRVPARPKWL